MKVSPPFPQDAAQGVRGLDTSMIQQIEIAAKKRYYVGKITDSCKFGAR